MVKWTNPSLLTLNYLRQHTKYSFRNTIRVSNGSDSDQDRLSVCPDLGPNCLQSLSVDLRSGGWQGNMSTVIHK